MVAEGTGSQASGAIAHRRRATLLVIYMYKEGVSRTVVREVLPRAKGHGHQTFPDYGRHTRSRSKGGDVRNEAPAEEGAAKTLQTSVSAILDLRKKYAVFRACSYAANTKEEPQPLFANVHEKHPNVPSSGTLYLKSI